MSVSAIILAGGMSTRMGLDTPKPFLKLGDKLVVQHSLDLFLAHPLIDEVILVCALPLRFHIKQAITFAEPGKRRQDSLYNGLQLATGSWICVHDAARPFFTADALTKLIEAGKEVGAATLALPARGTIKQSRDTLVEQTLDRSEIWEAQTPQIVSRALLERGFAQALTDDITVTDDVALAELVGGEVKLVEGPPLNFKLTSQEDYQLAKAVCGAV